MTGETYQHLTVLGDDITDQRNHYACAYYQWLADWLRRLQTTNPLIISSSAIAPRLINGQSAGNRPPTETDLLLIYAGINDFE